MTILTNSHLSIGQNSSIVTFQRSTNKSFNTGTVHIFLPSIHVKYKIIREGFVWAQCHLGLTWRNIGTNSTHVYEFPRYLWPDPVTISRIWFQFLTSEMENDEDKIMLLQFSEKGYWQKEGKNKQQESEQAERKVL
jgi:hypothetical protein